MIKITTIDFRIILYPIDLTSTMFLVYSTSLTIAVEKGINVIIYQETNASREVIE